MHDIERFSTDRLVAERLTEEHFSDLCLLWQDPRVVEYTGGVRSDENIRGRLTEGLEHWAAHGYGRWMFRDGARGGLAGYCQLRHSVVEASPEVELGYAVRPELWGRGLGTEMIRSVLSLAFGPIGLESVIALIDPANISSRRVAEKAGLKYERDSLDEGEAAVLYRIRRSPFAGH